jgi:oligosaccharyltransferase complex subunit gamma
MGRLSGKIIFLALAFALVAFMSTIPSGDAQPSSPKAILGKKVARLQAKATKNKGLIELDSVAFEEVMAMPRNYSMVVLFTAISPEFNCVPCM